MEEAGRTHLRFALHGVHNAFLAMLVAQQRAQHRRHLDAGEGFPGVGGHLLAAVGAVHLLTRRARAAFRGAHSPARAVGRMRLGFGVDLWCVAWLSPCTNGSLPGNTPRSIVRGSVNSPLPGV